ncbi:hypothetical protein GCM10011588_17630 [Nocardia jinanensis]|uniref:Uncharacterized protein n=1 Tax=Nocardia jinanensis TaxID=382504 RepID=A0A917VNP8_9NOCA|nr:hypothetical protein GCM10011588_17630 [Nocardia jinanensis]
MLLSQAGTVYPQTRRVAGISAFPGVQRSALRPRFLRWWLRAATERPESPRRADGLPGRPETEAGVVRRGRLECSKDLEDVAVEIHCAGDERTCQAEFARCPDQVAQRILGPHAHRAGAFTMGSDRAAVPEFEPHRRARAQGGAQQRFERGGDRSLVTHPTTMARVALLVWQRRGP